MTNHTFKKSQLLKSSIVQQPGGKKMQNLKIFGKIIVHLQKQLHKIEHWNKKKL